MKNLQNMLDSVLKDIPYTMAANYIAEKLKEHNIHLSEREIKQLGKHLKQNNNDTLKLHNWKWWKNKTISLNLSKEDIEEIEKRYRDFITNKFTNTLQTTLDDIAKMLVEHLTKSWKSELRYQMRIIKGFKKRLYLIWGEAINRLNMLLTVARELGSICNQELRAQQNLENPHLIDVLTRLHARACQITDEIICLLSSGFSDGAMARWRTLHEIAAVSIVISKHGESLATKYIEHEAIESCKAARAYRDCYERLGYEPLDESEFNDLLALRKDLIAKYGKEFDTQYGWISGISSKKNPTLRDIEIEAGIDHMRAHYRLASHNVHANPKGVYFKLGLHNESDILLSGPSNAGLADPGHSTAVSLIQVTSSLTMIEENADSIVGNMILLKISNDVGRLFYDAHIKLENLAIEHDLEKDS